MSRRMQNRYANFAIRVNIGMQQLDGVELHLRRRHGVVFGEAEGGWEDAELEGGVDGAHDEAVPFEKVVFGFWAGDDAFWRVFGYLAILGHEALDGGAGHF